MKNLTPRNNKGIRDGYWEVYHNNGFIWFKGRFINGKESGIWEFYSPNGKLKTKELHVI